MFSSCKLFIVQMRVLGKSSYLRLKHAYVYVNFCRILIVGKWKFKLEPTTKR